jgi:mannose-6-phosphate isomerase-like protein (cupin superfamily)
MDIIRRDDCPPFVTKDGSEIRELMAYRNSACKTLSLAEATIHPGRSTDLHRHPVCEEVYYFLRGTGRQRCGDETRDVGPGDVVLHPPGRLHQTWNTGEEPLVFLCVCCPPYEHEDTEIVGE